MLVRTFLGVKKMKRNLAVLLAVAVAILPVQASAQAAPKTAPSATPAAAVQTEAEARAELSTLFAAVDRNKNGKMTRQEMQIFGIQNRIGTLVNLKTWKRADKDKNNWISRDEFTNYALEERKRKMDRMARKRR